MFWLIPVAIGGAVYLILQVLKENAEAEYERWDSTYSHVQDLVCHHRQAITEHIQSARQCFDFHSLCELHFASVKVANAAYKLLHDAKVSQAEIQNSILAVKVKMADIDNQIQAPGLSRPDCYDLHSQLAELSQLKVTLFDAADTISEQVNHLLAQVRQLNQETHDLECSIRDHCGWRGAEWFSQMRFDDQNR